MGHVFEIICKDYLLWKNSRGELPILFTDIGRWWGTDADSKSQVEIDLIARENNEYMICECKWKNEPLDYGVLQSLKKKADIFRKSRGKTWYVLFSKSGFTEAVWKEAEISDNIMLISLDDLYER